MSRAGRAALVVLVTVVVACVLAGCAGPRNSLGTGSTACFRALPPAEAAVHHRGRYLGVRQVKASTVAKNHPEFSHFGDTTLCVAAFRGTFGPGSVTSASPTRSGSYALVVVDAKTAKLLGAFLADQLPLHFSHRV